MYVCRGDDSGWILFPHLQRYFAALVEVDERRQQQRVLLGQGLEVRQGAQTYRELRARHAATLVRVQMAKNSLQSQPLLRIRRQRNQISIYPRICMYVCSMYVCICLALACAATMSCLNRLAISSPCAFLRRSSSTARTDTDVCMYVSMCMYETVSGAAPSA